MRRAAAGAQPAHRRRCSPSIRRRPALEFERRWHSWGELGATADAVAPLVDAGRAGRRPAAQPAGARSGCCSGPARRRLRRHDQPDRGTERVRADLASLERRHRRRRARRPRRARARPARWLASDAARRARRTGRRRRRRTRRPRRSRPGVAVRDAHQRHDRAARSASTSPTRRSSGCSSAPSTTSATASAELRLRPRRDHRQLAARPPRRAVPRPAVRERRPLVLPARAVHGRRLGRRRAPPPARDRQPRARRAAHGARGRPRPGRPRERALGRLGHRAARPRRRRRVPRRSTACPCSISYAATEFGGGVAGWNLADHEQFWADEAGQRRPGPPRLRAARRRPRRRARRSAPDEEGLLEVKAAQLGDDAAGSAPPTWPASTPTASSGSSAAPTRRSSAAGSRSGPTTCAPRSSAHPRGAGRGGGRPRRRAASARCRSRPSSCAPARRRSRADDLLAARRRRCSPATSCPTRSGSSTSCPAPPSGKVDLAAVARAVRRAEALSVDLRYTDDDEAFRAELRAWLERRCPRTARRPPPGDWPARRAYDTGWQRKLHDAGYAGLNWPSEYGGRGLPSPSSSCTSRSTPAPSAPYVGVNFVGIDARRARRSSPRAPTSSGAFHLPRILRGESVWCQGFSEPEAGSDLASLRTRAVRDGDEYVVNGQKIWSTRAHVADYCELLVRTDPDAPEAQGHHLADPRHAPAGRRGPADADHRRREPLLRGVPRRRPGAGRRTGSATRTTAGGSPT